MNIITLGGSGLLVMTAILLSACAEPSMTASGQSSTFEQNQGRDQHKRCCHRAGRNDN